MHCRDPYVFFTCIWLRAAARRARSWPIVPRPPLVIPVATSLLVIGASRFTKKGPSGHLCGLCIGEARHVSVYCVGMSVGVTRGSRQLSTCKRSAPIGEPRNSRRRVLVLEGEADIRGRQLLQLLHLWRSIKEETRVSVC